MTANQHQLFDLLTLFIVEGNGKLFFSDFEEQFGYKGEEKRKIGELIRQAEDLGYLKKSGPPIAFEITGQGRNIRDEWNIELTEALEEKKLDREVKVSTLEYNRSSRRFALIALVISAISLCVTMFQCAS